jgi:hypothetical protein
MCIFNNYSDFKILLTTFNDFTRRHSHRAVFFIKILYFTNEIFRTGQAITLGESQEPLPNYLSLGFTSAHADELIQMATYSELLNIDESDTVFWAANVSESTTVLNVAGLKLMSIILSSALVDKLKCRYSTSLPEWTLMNLINWLLACDRQKTQPDLGDKLSAHGSL